MTEDALKAFSEVWLIDFEFSVPPGERPSVVCMVAREARSGQRMRLWADDLSARNSCPFSTDADTLFVAYYSPAELSCFLSLGWKLPARILDLYVEFVALTNGLERPHGAGLLGALLWFGLPAIDATDKKEMQQLASRGGPFSAEERSKLLDYCESDVDALACLLPAMLPTVDIPRALYRGRYMAAVARMEATGIPVDVDSLARLRKHWRSVQTRLIREVDASYGVFVPTHRETLDPSTAFGAEILKTATEAQVDPYELAATVKELHTLKTEEAAAVNGALSSARKQTGLTPKRIDRLEDAGKDSASIPHLDTLARRLAGEFPELAIGPGFEMDGGDDSHDYAAGLFDRLRSGPVKVPSRHSPELIAEALERLPATPSDTEPLSFNRNRFEGWLAQNGIPWPRLPSGDLDLSDDTFRSMAKRFPVLSDLRELRHTLGQLRLNELAVGADGRNRVMLSPFRAKTGRNQPSNSQFVFGPSCWVRGLIRPEEGRALAYIDWSAQEIGIAAALSGDPAMIEAYTAGDPYLWLAKRGGFAPGDATKQTYGPIRETFKVVYLAANYGMAENSLAQLIGKPPIEARELLRLHRDQFPKFWRWSDAALTYAMLHRRLWTVFNWPIHVGKDARPTSLRNFPVQANGAEMLRLACCLATERGIAVCAPIHDALLIEAAANDIETAVTITQAAMRETSEIVLSGLALRSDVKLVRWPDRYMDGRGRSMWDKMASLTREAEAVAEEAGRTF